MNRYGRQTDSGRVRIEEGERFIPLASSWREREIDIDEDEDARNRRKKGEGQKKGGREDGLGKRQWWGSEGLVGQRAKYGARRDGYAGDDPVGAHGCSSWMRPSSGSEWVGEACSKRDILMPARGR